MNTELIKNAIRAFKSFVAACGNDVCADAAENEYVIFSGQVAADNQGNIKTYSSEGTLVAQIPLRPILNNLAEFASSMVDLYEDDQKERKAEAEAQAEADEAENQELNLKIQDLESEISSLKLRKKSVRHHVKRF